MDDPLKLPEARQQTLAARAAAGRTLGMSELVAEFGVSADTIRRDLLALEARGLVRRVRGGALPVTPPAVPMVQRLETGPDSALRVARAALILIEDGMVVMLGGGTTVLRLAESLPALPRGLVVTPSPAVAMAALAKRTPVQLIGGRLSTFGAVAVGSEAEHTVRAIAADLCCLGVCGLDTGFGLSMDDPDEASLSAAMIEASGRAAVLTSAPKIGRRARHRVVPCANLDILVTDADTSLTTPFADAGLEITHA